MRSRIIIEIDTKFRKIVEADENGSPTTVEVTEDIERKFHKFIEKQVLRVRDDMINDAEYLEDFFDETDCYIDGYDSFQDYGDVKVNVQFVFDKESENDE